jgi:hypothetical protein
MPETSLTGSTTSLLPPALLGPANGSTVSTARPTFDWRDVTGAAGYEITISGGTSFNVLFPTSGSQFTPPQELPVRLLLNWRVRTVGSDGSKSAWTPPWAVTCAPTIDPKLK